MMRSLYIILVILLLASPSWAVPAHVQTVEQTAINDDATSTISITTTAGNLLLACIAGYNDPSYSVTSVSGGATWSQVADSGFANGSGFHKAVLWKGENATGGATTVTLTSGNSTGNYIAWSVSEYSGILTSASQDQTVTAISTTAVTTSASGSTGTTTQADELVVACGSFSENDVNLNITTPTTGYTNRARENDASTIQGQDFSDKIVSSTGTQSASWTHDSAITGVIVATFKASAGGGGATVHNLSLMGVGQ